MGSKIHTLPCSLIPEHFLSLTLIAVLTLCSAAFCQTPPPWGKALSFGGSGADIGSRVRVDRKNNKYVAGGFSGTATFGTRTLHSAGADDGFVMKFRSDGTFGWIVQIAGPSHDQAFDIGFDGNENLLVSGTITGNVTFGTVHGSPKAVSTGGNSMFLAKYDPSGTLMWVQTGTGGGDNEGFGVAVNPASGVVYMTGRAQGTTTFSSANGSSHTVGGGGEWHPYLVKYDDVGNFQWGESGGASGNSIAHMVAIDSDNNAYLVGWFEGTITFGGHNGRSLSVVGFSPGPGGNPFPDDAFVTAYDDRGNVQWINHLGGYKAIATDVAVSPNGNISVTGFIGNIDTHDEQAETIATSQPPGSSVNLGGGIFTSPFNGDIFVTTYDPSGVLESASRIGGSANDGGGGIAFDSDGSMYIGAEFGGTFSVGSVTVTGREANNTLVLKFSSSSDLDWAQTAQGAGSQDLENGPTLTVNPRTDKVFVTGPFSGSAIIGATRLTSVGSSDIFFSSIPE